MCLHLVSTAFLFSSLHSVQAIDRRSLLRSQSPNHPVCATADIRPVHTIGQNLHGCGGIALSSMNHCTEFTAKCVVQSMKWVGCALVNLWRNAEIVPSKPYDLVHCWINLSCELLSIQVSRCIDRVDTNTLYLARWRIIHIRDKDYARAVQERHTATVSVRRSSPL